LFKTHLVQRATNRQIHSLPRATHATGGLQFALAGAGSAVGDGDRTLERIEDGSSGDLSGGAGECVAAMQAARRAYEARTLQSFERFADGRHGDLRALSKGRCALLRLRRTGELGE